LNIKHNWQYIFTDDTFLLIYNYSYLLLSALTQKGTFKYTKVFDYLSKVEDPINMIGFWQDLCIDPEKCKL